MSRAGRQPELSIDLPPETAPQASGTGVRAGVAAGLLAVLAVAGLAVQSALLPVLAQAGLFWAPLVPNLCLLVVVLAGLRLPSTAAALTGFAVGLLLDLAPPADHTAGRWALALLAVGYLAGHWVDHGADHGVDHGAEDQLSHPRAVPTRVTLAAWVAACSFVGTSVFALTGRLLGDLHTSVPGLLAGIGLGVLADAAAAALLLPALIRLLGADPAEAPSR